jgi:putative tryptophan/tyrosine transport system substrate-binding protein
MFNAWLLKSLAAELVAMNCDVILAAENFALAALLQAGAKVPLVVQVGSTLPELGFIASDARPGGNVTGLTYDQTEQITGKAVSILKDLVPNLRSVGCLTTVNNPGLDRYVSVARQTTTRLGMTLTPVDLNGPADFEPAFKKFQAEGVQAVHIFASHLTYTHMQQLIDLAGEYKIPDMTGFPLAAEVGALASYAPDIENLFARSIDYVDKILRGAKPGDLPVHGPTRFEFVLNVKRARALGLPISTSIRSLADHVIE